MQRIRFLGFPDEGPVTLGARQGGSTASLSVASWNGLDLDPTLAITVRRGPADVRHAPEAIWFEAAPEGFGLDAPPGAVHYRPEMHEVHYEWDFGDAGATYTAPRNILPQWRDANRGTMQLAAHVYQQPGTYTVTCTARRVMSVDPLLLIEASATAQVTVGAWENRLPDIAGGQQNGSHINILASQEGDFSDVPPEYANHRRATADEFITLMANAVRFDNMPILNVRLKRGEVFPYHVLPDWASGNRPQVIRISSWGDPEAPAPVIQRFGRIWEGWLGGAAVIVDGIDCVGTYDPVTEVAGPVADAAIFLGDGPYALVTGATLSNHHVGVHIQHPREGEEHDWTAPAPLCCVHDTALSDLSAYGVYGSEHPASTCAFLGMKDIDPGNAPSGGDWERTVPDNGQGPLRMRGWGTVTVDGSDFFGQFGWTLGVNWPDGTPATFEQPIFRIPNAGDPAGRGRFLVSRVAAEGGILVEAKSLQDEAPVRANIVVDQVIHVMTAATSDGPIQSETGAVSVRNMLAIKPDVEGAVALRNFVRMLEASRPEGTPGPGHYDEPVNIHNCTFVHLGAQDGMEIIAIDENWTAVSSSNNLVFTPGVTGVPEHVDFGPFDATELWPARYQGRFERSDPGLVTQYATPPGTVSLYAPQIGSPVLGAAEQDYATMEFVAYTDLRGAPRGDRPAIGALDEG